MSERVYLTDEVLAQIESALLYAPVVTPPSAETVAAIRQLRDRAAAVVEDADGYEQLVDAKLIDALREVLPPQERS